MPDLSIIQWAGIVAFVTYALWRAWPLLKARLPTFSAKTPRWQRERVAFEQLCELTDYCNERGETKAADVLRDTVLPLLLSPEVPDETD